MEPAVSAATLITALVGLVLPASVAGGWWLGGQPDLARVTMTGEAVRIVPRGVLRLLSFRRELVLARSQLRQVTVAAVADLPPGGLRSPGLAVPGLRAGTYRAPDSVSYWLVGRASRVVRIDVAGGPVDYVLIQVRDPEALAALLGVGTCPAAPA
jgi:hypothetical protein